MKASEIKIESIYETINGDKYIVLSIAERLKSGHKKYNIKFIETQWETIVYQQAIITGQIKDRMKPSVFGIGYIKNASSKDNMKLWNLWHNMMSRCYNIKSKDYMSYGGIGVTVDEKWHCFEYFLEDISDIDGYVKGLIDELVLDKDLKQQDILHNERIYSKDTCCFITKKENQLYRDAEKTRKNIIAISPEGKKYYINGIVDFCREHELYNANVYCVLRGEWEQYNGWKFKRI